MDIKRTISITEARKRIFEIAEEVQAPHKAYTLTAEGKPKAVIMSAEEYESLIETVEVLSDFPDIKKDVAEMESAIQTGAYKKWPTLADIKRGYGMAVQVAEKPKKNYGVQSSSGSKGAKKPK